MHQAVLRRGVLHSDTGRFECRLKLQFEVALGKTLINDLAFGLRIGLGMSSSN